MNRLEMRVITSFEFIFFAQNCKKQAPAFFEAKSKATVKF